MNYDGLPENCHSTTVDTAHLKLCCHTSSNNIDPVVNRCSSASSSSTSISCDNRSDYISSDLSEGLSLSDAEDKILKDNTNKSETYKLETSKASSQMYHHVPSEAYDEIRHKQGWEVIRSKLGNARDDSFSNGILPIKEVEHLDIIGTPKAFKRTTLSPAKEDESSLSQPEIFEEEPLESSSPKQVNERYIFIGFNVEIDSLLSNRVKFE